MVRIGIIGAMQEEIDNIKSLAEIRNTKEVANLVFYEGVLEDKLVVIVQCGIGKINATLCTQLLISQFEVDYVINLGAAGSLQPYLKVGDIVVATDLVQHDMDCVGFGYEIGVTPGYSLKVATDSELLGVSFEVAEKFNTPVYLGTIATGDLFVSNNNQKEEILNNFNAQCCEMEGYAVASTCYANNVSSIVIRAISDGADDKAQISFDECLLTIVNNVTQFVVEVLKNL